MSYELVDGAKIGVDVTTSFQPVSGKARLSDPTDIAGMLDPFPRTAGGDVSCGEDLYIDGQVEGTIDPKGNRLIIGPNGSVKANINARAVIVQGKLEGTIHASDRVDLKQSAIVVGNITTQRISIEEGAHLKGSVNLQNEAPK